MGFFSRLMIFFAAIAGAYYMVKYRERLVRIVGKNSYAERYLGAGGSYTMWVIIALIIVGVAAWYLAY